MSDGIVGFSDADAKMDAAINEAKQSITTFFENFAAPKPNQEAFLLKVAFESDDTVEHIWIADLDASVMPLEGTVANQPNLAGISYMQRIAFDPSQITDWMYVEDGYLVGGFTTKLIRSNMTLEERTSYDRTAPYKFRD